MERSELKISEVKSLLHHIIKTNKTNIFKEDLSNYTDFRTENYYYMPILNP